MNKIISILMRRDGISRKEALAAIQSCREDVDDEIREGSLQDAEDAIAYHLGLEPDYLDYFLF